MTKDPQLVQSMFSGPIPGHSWTHEPKSMAWQKPPQHTKLEDTMKMLMQQLTDPQHLKQLLQMMDGGMSIEAITRVILMTGFASGKWTPDLALLMYKPLMLSLTAIAHRAGLKDTPMVMKEGLDKHVMGKMKNRVMIKHMKGEPAINPTPEPLTVAPKGPSGPGFMSKS